MSADPPFTMNRRETIAAGAAAALASPLGAAGTASHATGPIPRIGRDQPFDFDWRFLRGDGPFEKPEFDDAAWRMLDLPHDWSIEDLPDLPGSGRIGPFDPKSEGGTATAFTVGGVGWYRKHFTLPALPPGAHAEILFDGVYGHTELWLNGAPLGRHVHGYTPFALDLTPHLRTGENVIAVRVSNLGRNSRWYSGSGIFRAVTLDVLPRAARIARWGIGVSTVRLQDAKAEIQVDARLEAAGGHLTLVHRVRDPQGAIVAEHAGVVGATDTRALAISTPRLWSPDSPALYTLETELREGAVVLDRMMTRFGVRIVTVDAQNGLRLNGAPMKLRGGCVHHDNGILGAAAHADAEARRVKLLKARGYNAIRSSHNPSSRAFADACDRLGMLLIEEAFDMWSMGKNPQDYANDFAEWSERDLSTMVLSARHHPCVIMWSIGNEIPGRLDAAGQETAWRLANIVHRIDPTRPVTSAINGFGGRPVIPGHGTARAGFAGQPDEPSAMFLDIVGYNYKLDHYLPDHARYPRRVIYGSETFPKDVFTAWKLVEENPHVIGDFVWTAMDYLGEAGIGSALRNGQERSPAMTPAWPWIGANCGDIDMIGMQRPQSRARDVAWGLSTVEIAVQRPLADGEFEHPSLWGWSDEPASWTWPGTEGRQLAVRVYARADRIELRLNGALVATRDGTATEMSPAEFRLPYRPGTLQAIAYRGGREAGRRELTTAGPAIALRIAPEAPGPSAGRGSLRFAHVELVDDAGRHVPDLVRSVRLTVSGPARLIAFGSASPIARGGFQSSETETFDGRALAVLRLSGAPGVIKIGADAVGLRPGETSVMVP